MKVNYNSISGVGVWRWNLRGGSEVEEEEEDVCGICRVVYDGCCPDCKIPGETCPLSESVEIVGSTDRVSVR